MEQSLSVHGQSTAANNRLDFSREAAVSEVAAEVAAGDLPAALVDHPELYRRAARLTERDTWHNPQCARAACITALMAGAVTFLPLLDHCLQEDGASLEGLWT